MKQMFIELNLMRKEMPNEFYEAIAGIFAIFALGALFLTVFG